MPKGRGGSSEALHVRGRVLPEGDVRDVYVVGDRFTFEPPPKASTVLKDAWLLPGLVGSLNGKTKGKGRW